ncbi:MAG: hypothetical protein H6546_07095, partial [Chitinophagales bacterium]|nr:hypothetical protein [Chitinophagales bacterium]
MSPYHAGTDEAIDSNLQTVLDPLENVWLSDTITLNQASPSNQDLSIDAGIYDPVDIGDYVWLDSNANGIQDTSEEGMDNVVVELYWDADGDGMIDTSGVTSPDYLGSTVTGDNPNTAGVEKGWYEFTDLVTGEYKVKVIPPLQYAITPYRDVSTGGGDDTNDSD